VNAQYSVLALDPMDSILPPGSTPTKFESELAGLERADPVVWVVKVTT
jgi:hypothetical protein